MVLGRSAHHGRAADIDILDRLLQRATGACHGLAKRIQVDHHQIDGRDASGLQCCYVRRVIASGQDCAMDGRMQGLDPAIEHLGHAGDAGHFSHRNAGLRQCRGRAASGQ